MCRYDIQNHIPIFYFELHGFILLHLCMDCIKKYDLATYTGMVWLNSINYWKNPKSRFNYYIDVTAVRSGIMYHLIRAPDSSKYIIFYTILNTGLCYISSRYCLNQKNYILSTVSHAGLHLITGVGLIYLYSTKMTPLSKTYLLHYIQYYSLLSKPFYKFMDRCFAYCQQM